MGKILIIGNNGQLGSDCMSVLKGVAGIDFPAMDIAKREECLRVLDRIDPDVVVNCAAYTAVDDCESDSGCWGVNAEGPANIAAWTSSHEAFLIQISTDYVFDGRKPLYTPWFESDPTGPLSEYGKSKLAGEEAVVEQCADFAILRTAWLYGAKGDNILKKMLRLALKNPQREIRVVDDQFGSPTWSYTLARQIGVVIETRARGTFHAASEGYCSWYDLASRFLSLVDIPFRMAPCGTDEYPTPAPRPRNSILENSALKNRGINEFKSWETELATFVSRYRDELLSEAEANIGVEID